MKLRRSLALAAATAVLSPVVLLTASVAQAEEGSASPSATESVTPGGETEPEGEVTTTPAAADTTTPAAADTSTPPADSSTSAAPVKDAASSSASTSASPSASASASAPVGPEDCEDGDDMKIDDDLHTSLSGLPSKIVAGSGFHGFKLNVKNSGSHSYKRVDLGVFAAAVGGEELDDATDHLTLQYQDPSTGDWNDISVAMDDDAAGYLGYTDVKAKESFSIDLRLAVDKKAPAGFGFAISIGSYADDEGNCVYASDDDFYEFDILAAGTSAGPVDDSTPKPQGGSKPLPTTKPAGNTEIVPEGHLAETGAGSALPVIALAGGAAVALGVGAVFVVRRRRNEGGNVAV
ncbi:MULTISPECIES: LPXTG cell wall anchor domain-containing protein [unclassified Streptomyces]|uniref:LPXTG cell wall anchor domain-containing protein n=1 Tax=unclassified Streptomyces TaxID=2593676 RepID=UPI002E81542A|nr:LPXTG cell wall anchor domain-containing protein [Streptomyces sp. NBC_00566]WUB87701.1 LPXTG cell wall anchor domain-containing protein [Streptomyces sp. NBC_00566]